MSEEHKAITRRFYTSISAGRLDVIDEFLAEDFVEHEEFPGLSSGRDGTRQFFQMMRSAFSEFTMTIEDILAEGDRVVVRAKMSGTHQGDFMGIPATGRQIDVAFADFVRFEGGKVVEPWGVTDTGAMMEQLNG